MTLGFNLAGVALEIDETLEISEKKLSHLDQVYISRVIDGDTIEMASGEKIRLIGIDTPETKKNGAKGEHYCKKAYEFTKRKLEGKTIYLEYDIEKRDKYDRILAYVFLKDGTFFNARLLQAGYAQLLTVPPNVKYVDLFKKLARKARKNNRGLWGRNNEVDLPIISWREAKEHVGEEVIIKGEVVDTHNSGEAIFLNFHPEYWHNFTAVIFVGDKSKFDVEPANYYLNKVVQVRGKIKKYKGTPEIILRTQKQIEVVKKK